MYHELRKKKKKKERRVRLVSRAPHSFSFDCTLRTTILTLVHAMLHIQRAHLLSCAPTHNCATRTFVLTNAHFLQVQPRMVLRKRPWYREG
jgi:hypothetical protein